MAIRDEIEARLTAATPGPWEHGTSDFRDSDSHSVYDSNHKVLAFVGFGATEGVRPANDAEFIAHAPEDIRELLAENDVLRALAHIGREQYDRAQALEKENARLQRLVEMLEHPEMWDQNPSTYPS